MANFQVFCKDNFIKHYSPISKVHFGCCCGDEMLKKIPRNLLQRTKAGSTFSLIGEKK